MTPAAMLMDWPTIWAMARIARIIQARWIPFGERVLAGVGVVVTAMALGLPEGGGPANKPVRSLFVLFY
jgi:hypothetical protein